MKSIKSFLLFILIIFLLLTNCTMQVESGHVHTFSDAWTSDSTKHWHASTCEHTKEVRDKEKHSFGDWSAPDEKGTVTRSCTVCGYIQTDHKHVFASEYSSDSNYHWQIAICEHKNETTKKEPHIFGDWSAPDEKGSVTRNCTVCGYTENKHEHIFSETWEYASRKHWHRAICEHTDEKKDYGDCIPGEYSEVDEVTGDSKQCCTICGTTLSTIHEHLYTPIDENGNKTCTRCGGKSHEHVYSTEWTTSTGEHWRKAICNYNASCQYYFNYINREPHTYSTWSEPDAEGTITRSCTVCGYVETGHKHIYSSEWSYTRSSHMHLATCNYNSSCKSVYNYIDSESHTFGDWSEPDAEGTIIRYCTVCNYLEKGHAHVYSNEWINNEKYHWHKSTCNYSSSCTNLTSDRNEHTYEWSSKDYATTGNLIKFCTVCGYSYTSHSHIYSTEWNSDSKQHWHTAICNYNYACSSAKSNTANHTYGDWSEPDAEGTITRSCTVCGYITTDHAHVYSTEWTPGDDTYHWHVATCEHTDEKSGKEKHTFGNWTEYDKDGISSRSCTVCGYTNTRHTHVYSKTWTNDEKYHWHAATCTYGSDCAEAMSNKVGHSYSSWSEPNGTGEIERNCRTCGYTEKGKHTYSNKWTSDENYHWHTATCEHTEEITEKKNHSYGSWSERNKLTGNRTRCCTVCGYVETDHAHVFSENWTSGDGYHWHAATCEHTEEISDKATHSYSSWSAPDSNGTITRSCTVCGIILATDHKHIYSSNWTTDETYHWHSATCEHTEETSDKASHTFGSWSAPDENGTITKTCTKCGYVTTNHQHVYSSNWTTDETYHWHVATCEHTTEIGNKGSHSYYYTAWTEYDPITGDSTRSCTVCGYIEKRHTHMFSTDWTSNETSHWHGTTCGHTSVARDSATHTWDAGVITKTATCSSSGSITYTCTVCSKTKIQNIKVPHKIGVVSTDSSTGNPVTNCTVCGERIFGATLKDYKPVYYGLSEIKSTGATYKYDGSSEGTVEKFVFGLLSDDNINSAITKKSVDSTKQDFGDAYVYYDANNKTIYMVPKYEDREFFVLQQASCLFSCLNKCKEFVGLNLLDTSKVTNMANMFSECSVLRTLDLSDFDTSNVTNMTNMFYKCDALRTLDISNFDTSNVINMSQIFYGCYYLKELNLSKFNTSKVTRMDSMFRDCSNIESLNLISFDTSNVTRMDYMFWGCSKVTNIELANFNTSSVTNMEYMFSGCKLLSSVDVSNFDTSNVTNMEYMFDSCNVLGKIDVSNFNTSNVTNMTKMFYECKRVNELDVSNFNTSNVTSMAYMFTRCLNVSSLDLSKFNTLNVTDMDSMFCGCGKIKKLDLSNFKTANVTNMDCMFSGCESLVELNVTSFDTCKVRRMTSAFAGLKKMTELDLSSFETSKVIDMECMFANSSALKAIYVSYFTISSDCIKTNMFYNCGVNGFTRK